MLSYIAQSWKAALVWAVSLVVVGLVASALTLAQTANEKRVISGGDVGFRVDSERNGVPTGRLVVRVNGQWIEAKESVGPSRLTQ